MSTQPDEVLIATAIDAYNEACVDHREAVVREKELEANRPPASPPAILRLMRAVNPTSGESQKLYSASAAEAVVETDHEYYNYLREQRDQLLETMAAKDRKDCLRFQIELSIAQVMASAPQVAA